MELQCNIGDYVTKDFFGEVEGIQVKVTKELVCVGVWVTQDSVNGSIRNIYRLAERYPICESNGSRVVKHGRIYDVYDGQFTQMGPTESEVRKKQNGH